MTVYFAEKINTPLGVFLIHFSSKGIYEIFFPGNHPAQSYADGVLPWPQLQDDLNRYICGEQVSWADYPLDRDGYTAFMTRLLAAIREIPYGKTWSYRQAAEKAGHPLAWRAAGNALSLNRHPIIVPCHRVITSGGRTGGFSGPPGWKDLLLNLEYSLSVL